MTLLSFTRRWNNNEIAEMIREDTSYYTKGTKGDITTTLRYCHRHRTTTTIITKKDSRRNVTNNKSKKNNEKKEKKMNSIVNVITGLAFFL